LYEKCCTTSDYGTAGGVLKIKPGESINSGEWENRDTIPILQRFCILPEKIGSAHVDIGHAELLAYCMQEECLPPDIPRIVIMDSKSVRSKIIECRDTEPASDRYLLRKIYSRLGKTLMSRAKLSVDLWKNNTIPQENANHNQVTLLQRKLAVRNMSFIKHIQKWIDDPTSSNWKKEYSDSNPIRCILKVDSHQLNMDGSNIKSTKRRYDNLAPNLALLNANHWADKAASLAIKMCQDFPNKYPIPNNIMIPPNDTRFNITFNCELIEKQQSSFISNILEQERLKRLQTKEFQGAIFRLLGHITQTPRDIGRKSSFRRFISNLSKSHSRACYKSKQYLALNIIQYESIEEEDMSERFYDLLLTKKLLKDNNNILCCPLCDMHHPCQDDLKKETLGGKGSGDKFFQEINKVLLDPNLQKIGRLNTRICDLHINNDPSPPSKTNKTPNYVSIEEWCRIYQVDKNNLSSKPDQPILQSILGFCSAVPDNEIQECEMGLVDFLYLGLITSKLEEKIRALIMNHTNTINNNAEKMKIFNSILKTWIRIKCAIKGKNIILHRIIGEIITDREKNLRRKFGIPKSKVCKKILADMLEDDTTSQKANNESPLKTCKGPSCIIIEGSQSSTRSSSTPNQIKITHSHCARCTNLLTARRRCNTILKNIKQKANKIQVSGITNLCLFNRDNKNLIPKLLQLFLDITGEIKPWLTAQNIKPQKSRGIKINARKPASLAADIIIQSLNNFHKGQCLSSPCKFCLLKTPPTPNINPMNTLPSKNTSTSSQSIPLSIHTPNPDYCPMCYIMSAITQHVNNDPKTNNANIYKQETLQNNSTPPPKLAIKHYSPRVPVK